MKLFLFCWKFSRPKRTDEEYLLNAACRNVGGRLEEGDLEAICRFRECARKERC